MQNINKWLAGLAIVLTVIVIILVMVMQIDDDGTAVISGDSDTLAIVALAVIPICMMISETIRSGSFNADRLVDNIQLQNSLERHYIALPDGLPKKAIDIFVGLVDDVSKITTIPDDDKIAAWLRDATDGKINMPE